MRLRRPCSWSLATATVLAAAAHSASPAGVLAPSPYGRWRAPVHHAVIELYACGRMLCGRTIDSDNLRADPNQRDAKNPDPALRERPMRGLTFLQGYSGGPIEWRGGTIYNPDDGKTYRGSIRVVDGHRVQLTGCLVFPLCLSQTWTRAE